MIIKLTKISKEPVWVVASYISCWDQSAELAPVVKEEYHLDKVTVLTVSGSALLVRETPEEIVRAYHECFSKQEARQVRALKKLQRDDWEEE